MDVSGKIKVIGETQEFGNNGFRKRECVVTTQEQYPQVICVEFVQNNVDILNGFSVGDDVTIHINLRGREWTNPQGEVKYFTSLQGWRIEKAGAAPAAPAQAAKPMDNIPAAKATDAPTPSADEEDDDLPF